MSNFYFSHSIFKRHVLQTEKKPGLVWERINVVKTEYFAVEHYFYNYKPLLLYLQTTYLSLSLIFYFQCFTQVCVRFQILTLMGTFPSLVSTLLRMILMMMLDWMSSLPWQVTLHRKGKLQLCCTVKPKRSKRSLALKQHCLVR